MPFGDTADYQSALQKHFTAGNVSLGKVMSNKAARAYEERWCQIFNLFCRTLLFHFRKVDLGFDVTHDAFHP